jgi:hypothetical protein
VIVTIAWERLKRPRGESTVCRICDEDIAEAIKPPAESRFCLPQFNTEVSEDISEQMLEFCRNPLLDRKIRCVVISDYLVELLYLGH